MTTNNLDILDVDAAERLDIEWPDVYFTPGYGRAMMAWRGWSWRLAVWKPVPIIFPFLMRPIAESMTGGTLLYDAVSPYGYSGTTSLGAARPEEWRDFRTAWRRAAADLGIVGEFQRFNPFLIGHRELSAADPAVRLRRHNTIVTVPCVDIEQYWKTASATVRNRARRATRLGYKAVVTVADANDLVSGSPFRMMYEQTMKRVGATSDFLFPDEYYNALRDYLDDALLVCRVVGPDGETVSAGLFFHWNSITHFHIAGSDPVVRRDGCNILRLDQQIRWASEAGSTLVNLGGGRNDDDALFQFKANFGPGRKTFHVATAILDDATAAELARNGYAP